MPEDVKQHGLFWSSCVISDTSRYGLKIHTPTAFSLSSTLAETIVVAIQMEVGTLHVFHCYSRLKAKATIILKHVKYVNTLKHFSKLTISHTDGRSQAVLKRSGCFVVLRHGVQF